MSDEKFTAGKSYKNAAVIGAFAAFNPALAIAYAGVKLVYDLVEGAIGEQVDAARRDGREQGRNEAKAEYAHIFAKAQAQAEERKRHAREQNRYDDLTMTLFSVAVAILAQCRVVSDNNLADVKEFAFGSAHASLPAAVLAEIARIEAAPPNLATALARARKVAANDLDLVDQMALVASDCVGPEKGRELLSVWAQLRAA